MLGIHPALIWGTEWQDADQLLDFAESAARNTSRVRRFSDRAEAPRLRALYQPPVAA